MLRILPLVAFTLLMNACSNPTPPALTPDESNALYPQRITAMWGSDYQMRPDTALQIDEYIRSIHVGKDGSLWFGTAMRGVARYSHDTLVYYNTSNGLPSNQVNDIMEDLNGTIWIATSKGIVHYQNRTFTKYPLNNGYASEPIYCLLQDAGGTIWCGHHLGVSRFNGKAFVPYDLGVQDHVYCLAQEDNGTLWAGTACSGGVTFEEGDRSPVDFPRTGNCTRVSSMLKSADGPMWFGAGADGLLTTGGTSSIHESIRNLDLKGEIWAMAQAPNGDLWFAEIGNGLYRLHHNTFTHFDQTDGLDAHAIQSMAFDQQGRLWIGSGNGLFRMDGEHFINITKEGPW